MATSAVVQKEKQGITVNTTTPEGLMDSMSKAFDAVARRAFEIFESKGRLEGHDVEDWFSAEQEMFHPVHLELTESDEAVLVKVEAPGFDEKELQVNVEPRRLTISGKHESSKEEKKGKKVYSETCSQELFRAVDLPAEIDTAKVSATLKNGILQLTMPKSAKTVQVRPQAVA